jgi:thermostable 8-oxoguanine DNA glycosylase
MEVTVEKYANYLAYGMGSGKPFLMSQSMHAIRNGQADVLHLPAANEEVVPGVAWGTPDRIFSPAFWAMQAWYDEPVGRFARYRLGSTLKEEVAACVLGGFGMPAEMGLRAFVRVRERGLLENVSNRQAKILEALLEPWNINGRKTRYRFPAQKSKCLSKALTRLEAEVPPSTAEHLQFRDWLTEFDGIGPKTASWITRNFLDSDRVAILDVHVLRAGVLAGIFDAHTSVTRSYTHLETALVAFAEGLRVRLAILDTMIWCQMRHLSSLALRAMAFNRR